MHPLICLAVQVFQNSLGMKFNNRFNEFGDDMCEHIDRVEVSYEHPCSCISVYMDKSYGDYHAPLAMTLDPNEFCAVASALLKIPFSATLDKDSKDFTIRMDGLELHFLQLLIPQGLVVTETEEGLFKESIVLHLCDDARKNLSG